MFISMAIACAFVRDYAFSVRAKPEADHLSPRDTSARKRKLNVWFVLT
jgi:hypothetical protein